MGPFRHFQQLKSKLVKRVIKLHHNAGLPALLLMVFQGERLNDTH